ncbi:hypothetical protein J3F82_003283, partial [Coemansia sp. RSA 637]
MLPIDREQCKSVFKDFSRSDSGGNTSERGESAESDGDGVASTGDDGIVDCLDDTSDRSLLAAASLP